jgi:uncharacterized protein (DUF433 family)
VPLYLIREAAQYLSIPVATVRSWAVGRSYPTQAGKKHAAPLFEIAERTPPTLSFWNLVELYVLASITREHNLPMEQVRGALGFVQKRMKVKRPLIDRDFRTDGVDLFIQECDELVNVTDPGQLKLFVNETLARIAPDAEGLAQRLYPWLLAPSEPHSVEIDPRRAYGRLVVAGTSIATAALAERFRARDSVEHLAHEYGLTASQVEEALRWESRAPAA